MKKLFLLLCVTIFMFTLTSCETKVEFELNKEFAKIECPIGEDPRMIYPQVTMYVNGKITEIKRVDYSKVDNTKIGVYDVVFSHIIEGKTYSATFPLYIVDGAKPTLVSTANPVFLFDLKYPDYKQYITATDDVDGVIVITDEMIDSSKKTKIAGSTYVVYYNVCDSSNNCTKAELTFKISPTAK